MRRWPSGVVLIAASLILAAQTHSLGLLSEEMSRLKVDTALIFPSSEIDEHPIWSPTGEYLAFNTMDKWVKVDLRRMSLQAGTWHGKQAIGVATEECASSFSVASNEDVQSWLKTTKYDPRKIKTSKGTTIELKSSGLVTSLVITKKNGEPVTVWSSGGENCHSLALSPDEKAFAFLAEMNGLFVTKLND
jgi:hypothetical protein